MPMPNKLLQTICHVTLGLVRNTLVPVSYGSNIASFPGPAQFSIASVLQATESWAGPGNEASSINCTSQPTISLIPKLS